MLIPLQHLKELWFEDLFTHRLSSFLLKVLCLSISIAPWSKGWNNSGYLMEPPFCQKESCGFGLSQRVWPQKIFIVEEDGSVMECLVDSI